MQTPSRFGIALHDPKHEHYELEIPTSWYPKTQIQSLNQYYFLVSGRIIMVVSGNIHKEILVGPVNFMLFVSFSLCWVPNVNAVSGGIWSLKERE